jgi:hypothetical protein
MRMTQQHSPTGDSDPIACTAKAGSFHLAGVVTGRPQHFTLPNNVRGRFSGQAPGRVLAASSGSHATPRLLGCLLSHSDPCLCLNINAVIPTAFSALSSSATCNVTLSPPSRYPRCRRCFQETNTTRTYTHASCLVPA